jgi:HemY protein
VSPVTGAVDAFAWKAPVDAIGRGDDTLMIAEDTEPPRDASAMASLAPAEPADVVDVTPIVSETSEGGEKSPEPREGETVDAPATAGVKAGRAETSPAATPGPKVNVVGTERTAEKPASPDFMPIRPPDDPGVTQPDPDESPTSLERLRAAQIR